MNVKKIFAFFLLIVACAVLITAQDKDKIKDLAEKQRLEELQRLQDELKRNSERHTVGDINDLQFFLPKRKDSWYLSITESGGFAGVSRVVAAINSDGNYLCSRGENFQNQFVGKNLLASLMQKVEDLSSKKSDFNQPEEIKYCSDCLFKTLTFQKSDKFYIYNSVNFTNADDKIKGIYNEVINSAICQ